MTPQWKSLASKFDLLSQRERIMITIAALAIVGMVAFMILEAVWNTNNRLQNRLTSTTQENAITVQQVDLLQQRLQLDPNADYNQRLSLINEQMQLVDAELNAQMVDMVPADYMPTVLANLLRNVTGIKLVSFNSVAPIALLQVGDEEKMNLYSHGIKLVMEGDYFSVLNFVKAVESMPDKLYWQHLDYKVEQYPKAVVELELYTLSITKDFISVAK